jgi:hypothetical protein
MRPITGTSRSASAPGSFIAKKRASAPSRGVGPPKPNRAWPTTAVSPEARKLMATPETIWLPRWVMQAKPWISAISTETTSAAARPTQAEPENAATAPAAKAPASIFPSSPMSNTPERSE